MLNSVAKGEYFGVKTGGALAGFVIVFLLLSNALSDMKSSDVKFHFVFGDPAPRMSNDQKAYYRLNDGELIVAPVIQRAKDHEPHINIPSVSMNDEIVVWVETLEGWFKSDNVASNMRRVRFGSSGAPNSPQ